KVRGEPVRFGNRGGSGSIGEAGESKGRREEGSSERSEGGEGFCREGRKKSLEGFRCGWTSWRRLHENWSAQTPISACRPHALRHAPSPPPQRRSPRWRRRGYPTNPLVHGVTHPRPFCRRTLSLVRRGGWGAVDPGEDV